MQILSNMVERWPKSIMNIHSKAFADINRAIRLVVFCGLLMVPMSAFSIYLFAMQYQRWWQPWPEILDGGKRGVIWNTFHL